MVASLHICASIYVYPSIYVHPSMDKFILGYILPWVHPSIWVMSIHITWCVMQHGWWCRHIYCHHLDHIWWSWCQQSQWCMMSHDAASFDIMLYHDWRHHMLMMSAYHTILKTHVESQISWILKKYPKSWHQLDPTYVVQTISLGGGEACAFLQLLVLKW